MRDLSRQTTGVNFLSLFPFYLFLEIFGWLCELARDWIHGRQRTGFPVQSSTLKLDTSTGEVSLSVRSSPSRVSLSLHVAVVGAEDELEEDVEQCLSCLESVIVVEG